MGAIAQGLSPNSSPTENAHLAGPVPVVSNSFRRLLPRKGLQTFSTIMRFRRLYAVHPSTKLGFDNGHFYIRLGDRKNEVVLRHFGIVFREMLVERLDFDF